METKKTKKPRSSKPNPEEENNKGQLARISGIAFEIVAFNLVVIWGGYELDQYFDFSIPWMMILALVLAVVGTLYFIFTRLNQS